MDCKQVTQTSRPYKYGENEEFLTKEEALKAISKVEQKLKTEMVLQKIYDLSELKVVEACNALQIVVTTKIPNLLEERKE